MKRTFISTLLLVMAAILLVACTTPTPTVAPPTETPIETPVPPPPTFLLDCKESKCPVFIAAGTNDGGMPIIAINSGTYFELGDRIQFFYPCIVADGGTTWCEVFRDAEGNVYPADRYVRRDKLARVW